MPDTSVEVRIDGDEVTGAVVCALKMWGEEKVAIIELFAVKRQHRGVGSSMMMSLA